jgi:predicted nucleotidyltransferase
MDQALIKDMRAAAAAHLSGSGILVAYAYGSRVSGNPRPDSDLDIGFYPLPGRPSLSLREETLLAANLTEALGVGVDLRNLSEAPLELRGAVLEDGVRIFSADEEMRVDLEADILSRYHDYKDVFLRMHEERLASLASRV